MLKDTVVPMVMMVLQHSLASSVLVAGLIRGTKSIKQHRPCTEPIGMCPYALVPLIM